MHLACGIVWERIDKDNRPWEFVPSKPVGAMLQKLYFRKRQTSFQCDNRPPDLAPFCIWYSNDSGFGDRFDLVNYILNLSGINVLAARDVHVLPAIHDIEISF